MLQLFYLIFSAAPWSCTLRWLVEGYIRPAPLPSPLSPLQLGGQQKDTLLRRSSCNHHRHTQGRRNRSVPLFRPLIVLPSPPPPLPPSSPPIKLAPCHFVISATLRTVCTHVHLHTQGPFLLLSSSTNNPLQDRRARCTGSCPSRPLYLRTHAAPHPRPSHLTLPPTAA